MTVSYTVNMKQWQQHIVVSQYLQNDLHRVFSFKNSWSVSCSKIILVWVKWGWHNGVLHFMTSPEGLQHMFKSLSEEMEVYSIFVMLSNCFQEC